MGIFNFLRRKNTIPVRDIILDRTLLAGKLMVSKDKKEVERGESILKKVKEIEDLNLKYKGNLDWVKELKELDNLLEDTNETND